MRTIQRAVDLAEPGTVIQIRSCTYDPEANVQIQKSGTEPQPITMRAYEGEDTVIDGENTTIGKSPSCHASRAGS